MTDMNFVQRKKVLGRAAQKLGVLIPLILRGGNDCLSMWHWCWDVVQSDLGRSVLGESVK